MTRILVVFLFLEYNIVNCNWNCRSSPDVTGGSAQLCTCDTNECDIECIGQHACSGNVFICPDSSLTCDILCGNGNSCHNVKIYGSPQNKLVLNCTETHSCENVMLFSGNNINYNSVNVFGYDNSSFDGNIDSILITGNKEKCIRYSTFNFDGNNINEVNFTIGDGDGDSLNLLESTINCLSGNCNLICDTEEACGLEDQIRGSTMHCSDNCYCYKCNYLQQLTCDGTCNFDTYSPSISPTTQPTPQTNLPSTSPTKSTNNPTLTSISPTKSTIIPTTNTIMPSITTIPPTIKTPIPTHFPTISPTISTTNPTVLTIQPSKSTTEPTLSTNIPTIQTKIPSEIPTNMPTINTLFPSVLPTTTPTLLSNNPTISPSSPPTSSPSISPTDIPTVNPTTSPTIIDEEALGTPIGREPFWLALIQIIGGILFIALCGVCFVCLIERRRNKKNEIENRRKHSHTQQSINLSFNIHPESNDNINDNIIGDDNDDNKHELQNISKINENEELDISVPQPNRNRISSKSTLNSRNHLHIPNAKKQISHISNSNSSTSISDTSISDTKSSSMDSDTESTSDTESISDDDSDNQGLTLSHKNIDPSSNITHISTNMNPSDISSNYSNNNSRRPSPQIIRRSKVKNNHNQHHE